MCLLGGLRTDPKAGEATEQLREEAGVTLPLDDLARGTGEGVKKEPAQCGVYPVSN